MSVEFAVSVSYGNDSIALIQWLHENVKSREETVCVFFDTGWAAPWWITRVQAGEALAQGYGFRVVRLSSVGMIQLIKQKKGWPRHGMQFCTEELKIRPMNEWLDQNDPAKDAIVVVGIRREESARRASWPEWTEVSERNGGRPLWAPLVRHQEAERNELIRRSGLEVLPFRSQECYPCVNSSKADLRDLSEDRVALIESLETELGFTSNGKPRVMFRPKKKGGATGIREVVKWAHTGRGEYELPEACDSGMCAS